MILETSLSTLNYSFKIGNLCYEFMIFHFFPVQTTFLENLLKRYRESYPHLTPSPLVNKSAVRCKQMKRFHIPYDELIRKIEKLLYSYLQ